MRTMLAVLAPLALVCAVWFALGCESSTNSGDGSAAAVTDHKVTKSEVGIDAVCPVMKTPLKVSEDTLAAEYKGKVYYFCCPSCPGAFKNNPEKYIAQ